MSKQELRDLAEAWLAAKDAERVAELNYKEAYDRRSRSVADRIKLETHLHKTCVESGHPIVVLGGLAIHCSRDGGTYVHDLVVLDGAKPTVGPQSGRVNLGDIDGGD